ncbi:pleiotropic drug resistance ABC transporter [Phakopsora pachyrhizi]|uniref:Pleiotropic drug resistance ABC transporter n=1 Tax=Phakopsora pachyrhizi TaxID=170000 RepID=A0AAV0B6W4_PHAPC|nr:pleiotropic drug resistance ABC transporter [Phakopsora pachyrhizi]CAH7682783.1 pleiotropic drug resistance ABC transporter [Phakopsora pachyrhizi]
MSQRLPLPEFDTQINDVDQTASKRDSIMTKIGSLSDGNRAYATEIDSDETKNQTSADRSSDDTSADEINVVRAEREFTELARQLTKVSASIHHGSDKEKQLEEDEFDLVGYLRGYSKSLEENSFCHKHLGVIFTNLSVSGMGGLRLNIRTFPDAIKEHLLLPVIFYMKNFVSRPPKALLTGFNGFVKPGEMCFVLGRPNSGCSTFLKVIANQRVGFMDVGGEVEYGGIDSQTIAASYKGEVVYNPEDDVHHATLTVGQTLSFALSTKTPARRLPNQTERNFREQIMDLLLKILAISHTKNTLVGNAQVRGVSGGERKRVSIAEMMATRACVLAWDNSTRGLDASTALSYAKSLRILANIFKTTNFVTLYQAGEGIYEQFDKVCLISEGRQVYFGPASQARQYFMNLGYKNMPRQTTADYLTGCTDPNERQFADGVDVESVPKTAEELERAYLESNIFQQMRADMENYRAELASENQSREEFHKAVMQDRHRGVSKKSPHTVSVFTQLKYLMIREIQLKSQDKMGLIFSWCTSIIISVIVGSLFFQLPATSAGAFTRGGVIFIGLLFNVFISFIELPSQMMGRPIMWRQSGFAFYRPGVLALANSFADIPFSAPKIFVFSIILYFMAGLYSSAGAFFTYYVLVYSTFLALSAFFRFMGAISFSFDTAARMASILVITMALYSGYMIPEPAMRRWLVWIYYINPINYSFAALMGNEFGRLDIACNGASVIPNGPGYPDSLGANQICTLRGAQPGNPIVSGEAYISSSYKYSSAHVWRNFGIEWGYVIFFLTCMYFAVENLALGAGMPAINVFAKPNEERKRLNEALQANKEKFRKGDAEQNLKGLISTRKPFTWEALTYHVQVPGGQKKLLSEVYGYVKPGTLTALMGSSGAGKTTLLDVLANRKTTGTVSGDIKIGGMAPGPDFQRGTAYCEQQDVHEWTATVREAFRFSAHLRQPADISIEEKNAYVEEVIHLLELEDLADAMIGFPGFGLGVEARKRVTIGVELAAKPQLLLFLDEPTSGLDGQSAYNIVRFLRKLASAGQAILCTIHQPNAVLFENFDRLLLLKSGGRCVYFGGIGKDSHILREYFSKQGAVCPDDANPAEFMLEAIGGGNSRQMGGKKDWADRWADSHEHAENKREIEEINSQNKESKEVFSQGQDKSALTYAQPFWFQMKTVYSRANLSFYRNADYQFTRLYNHITIPLLVGLTFLQVGSGVADLQYRVFAIFITAVLPALIIAQVEPSFLMARMIYIREASSKTYSQEVFGISQFLAEVPYSTICAIAYYLIWYFLVGFNNSSNRAGYAFLVVWLVEMFAVTLGQAIAAISPSIFIASQFNPPIIVMLNMFCGVTVPQPVMPKFWRGWMYNLDPFTRFVSGLVVNALHDLPVVCKPEEFSLIQPPQGQTCAQWTQGYVNRSGGYIDNPSESANCRYCQYSVGDQFYEPLGYSFSNRWRDIGILVLYVFFNLAVMIIGAKYLTLRYAKR